MSIIRTLVASPRINGEMVCAVNHAPDGAEWTDITGRYTGGDDLNGMLFALGRIPDTEYASLVADPQVFVSSAIDEDDPSTELVESEGREIGISNWTDFNSIDLTGVPVAAFLADSAATQSR